MWELDYDGALLLRTPKESTDALQSRAFTNFPCVGMCVKSFLAS